MPTVEFSPDQVNYIIKTAYGGLSSGIWGTNGTFNFPYNSKFGSNTARLILFPGTIPAQPRLMTVAMIASTLVWWSPYSDNTSATYTNPFTVTTTYKAAIATGVATWFAYCTYDYAPPSTSGTLVQRIIGTVGTIGSGADLEMNTTSIVTGSQYRVYNFRIALPSTYTY